MLRIEKTVFISYRRTNIPWALAIYQYLTRYGYDVFFDYDSIASGDFEQVIIGNVKARAHFLVILTPSALERCENPDDWLRREIETALDEKRNIVPVFLEGFDFGSPSISKYLTGKLTTLNKYNGQNVPAGFFEEAMDKIRNRFLNIPLDAVLHPISPEIQKEVEKQQVAANEAEPVKEKELTAQEWFEKGNKSSNLDEQIHCYTEAIGLKPDYAGAYCNRGIAQYYKNDLDGAIKDYNETIRIKPDDARAYYNRGLVRSKTGNLDEAIKDYTEAIRVNPNYTESYIDRGNARDLKGDSDGAIKDYNETIRLNPNNPRAYYNRGLTRKDKGDLDGAIKDYDETIRLKSDYIDAYWARGTAWFDKKDYYSAVADYQEYLKLGGTNDTVRKLLNDAKGKIK